jgi:hypothetical protein
MADRTGQRGQRQNTQLCGRDRLPHERQCQRQRASRCQRPPHGYDGRVRENPKFAIQQHLQRDEEPGDQNQDRTGIETLKIRPHDQQHATEATGNAQPAGQADALAKHYGRHQHHQERIDVKDRNRIREIQIEHPGDKAHIAGGVKQSADNLNTGARRPQRAPAHSRQCDRRNDQEKPGETDPADQHRRKLAGQRLHQCATKCRKTEGEYE